MTKPLSLNLATATDAQINAMCAEVVGGWTEVGPGTPAYQWHHGENVMCVFAPGSCYGIVPDYLHDANAVLGLLEGGQWECWKHVDDSKTARVWRGSDSIFGRAATFPRAATIALLKAHGVEVVDNP